MTLDPDHLAVSDMLAAVTTGNGGFEMIEIRRVPVPVPSAGEVRIRVLAAGVNNTEINTRLGWYSETVRSTDDAASAASDAEEVVQRTDGGWNAATPWPLIQGTDCCGIVDQLGDNVDPLLLGRRVIVRACMRADGFDSMDHIWMASDFDGAFAEYVKVPASEVFPVDCDWSDAELGAIPCAYATAENMLHRADVGAGDRVLVTGASGGTGSASVQLAARRGAHITAMASPSKCDEVLAFGAHDVIARGETPASRSFDVVIDNVAGPGFSEVVNAVRPGGAFVPLVPSPAPSLNSTFARSTYVMCVSSAAPHGTRTCSRISSGTSRRFGRMSQTFPLTEIVAAQQEFLDKRHVGKFVLIP